MRSPWRRRRRPDRSPTDRTPGDGARAPPPGSGPGSPRPRERRPRPDGSDAGSPALSPPLRKRQRRRAATATDVGRVGTRPQTDRDRSSPVTQRSSRRRARRPLPWSLSCPIADATPGGHMWATPLTTPLQSPQRGAAAHWRGQLPRPTGDPAGAGHDARGRGRRHVRDHRSAGAGDRGGWRGRRPDRHPHAPGPVR